MNFSHFQNPMILQQQQAGQQQQQQQANQQQAPPQAQQQQQQSQLTVQQIQQQLQLHQQLQQQQGTVATAGGQQVTLIGTASGGGNPQAQGAGGSIQAIQMQPQHLVTQLQPHQLSQQQLQQLQMQVAVGNIPQHQQQQITQLQQLHMPQQTQPVIQQIQPQGQQQQVQQYVTNNVTGLTNMAGNVQQQQQGQGQGQGGQKTPKDKNKPKNPMSAYACFIQVIRDEHRRKHPNEHVDFSEFSKKCAEKWRSMTDVEKRRFEDMAQADKNRFNREIAQYVPPDGMRVKKRKATKDPGKPKRAWSAFFFFCDEFRPAIREGHPEWRVGDIAKELGRRWENCVDKSKYELKAQEARQRYEDEMTQYRAGTFSKQGAPPTSSCPNNGVVMSSGQLLEGQSLLLTPAQQNAVYHTGQPQQIVQQSLSSSQQQAPQMIIHQINATAQQQVAVSAPIPAQPIAVSVPSSCAAPSLPPSSSGCGTDSITVVQQQQQMMAMHHQQQQQRMILTTAGDVSPTEQPPIASNAAPNHLE